MALNLSTLTSPATSGDVLAEALTTADFLESVPVLRNLARGSQKGGDAKQGTALNQPKALPLIKNPQGKLGGYLYIPDVSGNSATGPSVTIGSNQTWEAELDMVITQYGTSSPFKYVIPLGTQGGWNSGIGFWIDHNNNGVAWSKGRYTNTASGITLNTPFNIKYGFDGTNVFYKINDVVKGSVTGQDQSAVVTAVLQLNQQTSSRVGNFAIQKAKLTVNSSVVFDCDFNGSTSIRHGDTKFNCVGGPVTLTRSSNDPITVVKKSVLRFSTATSGLKGLFANQIDGGYMFAAFSVLGTGVASGEASGRVFSINKTGGVDYASGGAIFSAQNGISTQLRSVLGGSNLNAHLNLYDDTNGDILHESKLIQGEQFSRVNNADLETNTNATVIESDEFNIGVNENGVRTLGENAAIDLEFLALFSVDSVPDEATAKRIRDYINGRGVHGIYLRHQTDGYYFFDPQKATFTGNFTGANTLDGYITGSDLGDTDVRTNLTLKQSTLNDQPSTDGYTITFHDDAEHLEFENGASQNLSGWQVVGSSLGTFVYRVQGAVTELNLLGNLGSTSFRQAGDLYGIILLPESATGADIEEARKLLIDRGAADGTTASTLNVYFYGRGDIVEFKPISFSTANSLRYTWGGMSSLTSFPSLDLTNAVDVNNAWSSSGSLSSFGTTEIPNCNNFVSAWQGTFALTSFPAGAKLGTEASNVNFSNAWRQSGLTSFSTPLPTATNTSNAWLSCHSLALFNTPLPLSATVSYAWFDCTSLTSFDTLLPLVTNAQSGWYNCTSLTSFDTPIPLVSYANRAWGNCSSLTDFSADVFANWNPSIITSGVFNDAWDGCSALSAKSVENILTSIVASGQFATVDGNSGSAAIADAAIDIDYNAASGSLSAATNAAVTSLKAKGWSIVVNGVTL